jgi:hypothetical protein
VEIIKKIRTLKRFQFILLVWIIWTIISILVLLIFPATRKGPAGFGPPAKMTTFQAADKNFSILYPANWTAHDLPQGDHGDKDVIASIIVAGHFVAYVEMVSHAFPQGDFMEVVDWGYLRATGNNEYKFISFQPITTISNNGYIHEYSWSLQNAKWKYDFNHCRDVYFYEDNIGYSFTFCSSEKDWSELQGYYSEMQNSISIKALR